MGCQPAPLLAGGIVFPPGSPLRQRVYDALLALREDGSYQQLYDRWFVSK